MRKGTIILYELVRREVEKGKSLTEAAQEFGIDRGKFSTYLKSVGVEVINHHNALKFDNTVFDSIDSEEKAYWLGFIYADGNVGKDRNTMEVSLSLKDTEHLKKLAKFFGCPDTKVQTDHFRCRLGLVDKHLKQVLISYGCIPCKSLVLKFPTCIPADLIRHFIRGYFDGDGSLFTKVERKGRVSLQCALLGTMEFLTECRKFLQFAKGTYRKNNSLNNTWSVQASNITAIKNATYMYKDASIYLERKYNIYSQFAVLDRND